MSFTAMIGGTAYTVLENTFRFGDKVDDRDTCSFSVLDQSGTANFTRFQPVVISDSSLNTIFSGIVTNPQINQRYWPTVQRSWSIQCSADQTYRLDKRTSNRTYTNQYAGVIAADQIQRYAADEGISGAFALRWDEQLTDWQQGTFSNTLATTNASNGNPGGGDLELALAGADTTITVDATDLSTGTFINTTVVGDTLQPTATPAIKFTAVCTLNSPGNLYDFMKIWKGSLELGVGYYFVYDEWVDPSSPEVKVAMDIRFSDGTNLRDISEYNDSQNMAPHPNTDLTGLADGQWYHREFWLANLEGKTIDYISVVSEGDKAGTYTAWFKNVKITDINKVTVLNVFNGTLNTAQQGSVYGYSSIIQVVDTYDLPFYVAQGEGSSPWSPAVPTWQSPAYSIDAVKILKGSFISWDATVPDGTFFSIKYTLDYPAGAQAARLCTNNAALPGLPAGLSVAGRSLTLFPQFRRDPSATTKASPEVCPILSRIVVSLTSSYVMSKTDVQFACAQASDWTQAGTSLTNVAHSALASKVLSLAGYVNNFDSTYGNSTNLYSTGTPGVTISNRVAALTVTSGTDARLKLNDPGQYANFTAECDILVSANFKAGLCYRCTGFQNANDTYAYAAVVTTNQVLLAHGTNSASGTGTATTISSRTVTLAEGSWHRLKLVVSGSSHQVFVDDFQFISATDSTYTAAGYLCLRIYNPSATTQTAQFNNFGVVNALSGFWLSPLISLASATTYGTSLISWRDQSEDGTNCTILVEATIDGGSTWFTCTNSAILPVLTAGQSLSGVNLQLRITLTSTTATAMPGIDNLIVLVLQQFSSSGTRTTAPIGWDSMQRSNVVGGFGTATNGQSYTKIGTGTVALISNEATISSTTNDVHMQLSGTSGTDEDALVRFALSASGEIAGIELRYVDANNFYRLAATTTTLSVVKASASIQVTLASLAKTLATSTFYQMRFRVVGSGPASLYGRVWLAGTTEPNTWDLIASD